MEGMFPPHSVPANWAAWEGRNRQKLELLVKHLRQRKVEGHSGLGWGLDLGGAPSEADRLKGFCQLVEEQPVSRA